MDCLKGNQTIYVQATPSLETQVIFAAKSVENPRQDQRDANLTTVFDAWYHFMPDDQAYVIPQISIPTGASDQKAFLDYLGVPSVNFAWIDMDKHHTYPLYHTLYETPFTVENLMDVADFAIHKAMGQYWIELAVRLADMPTIPYSLHTLGTKLVEVYLPDLDSSIGALNQSTYTKNARDQLHLMATSCAAFRATAGNEEALNRPRELPPIFRSRYNDKLINVERCFVNPRGTPDDATARHVLFSTSKTDNYAGQVMQQVYKVLDDMAEATKEQLPALGDELANQISIVHSSVLCGISAFAEFI